MSPCHGCHAGCCRSFAVPVTGADVLRIERETGRNFWDFACRWADPDGKIARRYAPHLFFADEPQTPFVLCLRHDESRAIRGTSKCRFLSEDKPAPGQTLAPARCGIYASRPMACRAFPTKFNATGELAVLHDVPAHGRADDRHPAYSLCPRPWRPEDVDPLQAPQDLAVARYEMDFFRAAATVWNQAPRPFDVFPDFLRLIYGRRVMPEPDQAPAETEPTIFPFPGVAARKAA